MRKWKLINSGINSEVFVGPLLGVILLVSKCSYTENPCQAYRRENRYLMPSWLFFLELNLPLVSNLLVYLWTSIRASDFVITLKWAEFPFHFRAILEFDFFKFEKKIIDFLILIFKLFTCFCVLRMDILYIWIWSSISGIFISTQVFSVLFLISLNEFR